MRLKSPLRITQEELLLLRQLGDVVRAEEGREAEAREAAKKAAEAPPPAPAPAEEAPAAEAPAPAPAPVKEDVEMTDAPPAAAA